jgi:hypothetical protein
MIAAAQSETINNRYQGIVKQLYNNKTINETIIPSLFEKTVEFFI